MIFTGEAAAVLTALCWSGGSALFTFSGRRIGSATVNRTRLWMALFLLMGLHFLMQGTIFPLDAEPERFFWLGISGLVGYLFGDGMLFESFVLIGPRLAMLMMTLVPIFSTVLAWFFLGEYLAAWEMLAIAITLSGVAWVVSEKKNRQNNTVTGSYRRGILLGMGGALGQAVGMLFAKKGLAGGFSAVSGNMIRVTAAALCIVLISVFRRDLTSHLKKLKDKKALIQIFFASCFGPVFGVVFSLYAIAHTEIGIASTLMSLAPLFLLPLSRIFFKEKITPRALIGTIIALAGSALLFFI
ncbi:MAG: DMT family transporter [Candidatus Aminicenantes bacterium]|nr:DMT family transporter [Candidatus Aminicenantes bacterium]